MNDKHESSNANQIASPWEGEKAKCDHVMHKHHPKVFSLYIKELWEEEWKVEGWLDVVVPPFFIWDILFREKMLAFYSVKL